MLTEQGQPEAASELFQQAPRDLPTNCTGNMDTAKVLHLSMQRDGRDERHLHRYASVWNACGNWIRPRARVQPLSALCREVAAGN